ncbi:hypothetical protein NFI96_008277 [Prochilodus magdalenae]|nr:hypothetical protein NFI96_008277 [Prochilodus magdalenae]
MQQGQTWTVNNPAVGPTPKRPKRNIKPPKRFGDCIARLRPLLTSKDAETLVHAFIRSRLDYCNALFHGLPSKTLRPLQYIQNSAARVLVRTNKSAHITPILLQLHWLPVTKRICYKILLLTFKALHGQAPTYLSALLHPYVPSHCKASLGTVKELRLVLLGKTGDGKSSCGNTILGEEEVFPTGNLPNSETRKCKPRTKIINQKEVTLVDTPGFYDTDRPEEELKSEILRCIIECAPGPHAFVIVLRVGRYTEQEKEIVKKITASFGEEALKYAVVLFTHGDDLSEGQTIEQFVEQSRELQELVEKCGGRVHVIDNKYWKQQQDGYRSNRVQVEKLLNTIEEMVRENGGQYYSNEILQEVHRAIEEERENIIRERKTKSQDINMNAIPQQARERVHTKLSVRLVGVATGALLGALLGGLVCLGGTIAVVRVTLAMAHTPLAGEITPNVAAFVVGAGAVIGAAGGGVVGYNAVEGAETMTEAMKRSAAAVRDIVEEVYENIIHLFQKHQKYYQHSTY